MSQCARLSSVYVVQVIVCVKGCLEGVVKLCRGEIT